MDKELEVYLYRVILYSNRNWTNYSYIEQE